MGGDVNRLYGRVRQRGQSGFTLIELLVVTSILTIMAGVVVFGVGKAKDNAASNACETERATFETAANASTVGSGDNIRSYLKQDSGLYFEVSGTNSFVAAPGSGYTADCVKI